MAQYNRLPTKKNDKQPDEFVSFFDRVVRYFLNNKIKLYGVIACFILALGAYGVYLYLQVQQVKSIATNYQQALETPDEKSLAAWQELEKEKLPLALKEVVAIQIAGRLSEKNDWPAAAKEFAKSAQSNSVILETLGQWSNALALENAKSYDSAYEAYQKLSQIKAYTHEANLGMARILSVQGKRAEAEKSLLTLMASEEASDAVKSAARELLLTIKITGSSSQKPLDPPMGLD